MKLVSLKTLINTAIVSVSLATTALLHAASLTPLDGKYAIDSAHSSIHFKVDHMGFTKVIGRFNEFEGAVEISEKESTLVLRIHTASVDSNHEKRDEHLRSPDFFNAKQFPQITLNGPIDLSASSGVKAELTLLGVRKPITLMLEKGKEGKDPWGLYRVGYSARTTIKRSDFGMDFMLGGIGDEVEIVAFIEAVKQ